MIRKDRGSRGGGVMLAIRNTKSYKIIPSPPDLEMITVSIGSSFPIIYCLAYVPPNSSEQYLLEFFNYLQSLDSANSNLVLLGDFNFGDINWNSLCGHSLASAKFCDIIFNLNLSQLITEPTHIAGNTLDLILTNIPHHIVNITVHSETPLMIPSDHYIITFDVHTSNEETHNRATTSFDFTKGDYNSLCHFLSNSDFTPCLETTNIESVWQYISELIKDGIKQFVPTIRVNRCNHPKWFNSSIRHNANRVRTLRRRYNRHPSEQNKFKLETNESLLQAEISRAKADYESSLISNFSHDNSKIYKYIRSFSKSISIPCSVYHDSICANSDVAKASLFNEYFYSVFTKATSHPSPPNDFNNPSAITELIISDDEVLNVLLNLDISKATGPDGIPPIVLQRCALALYQPLCYLFNLSLQFSYLPSEWKIHKIIPVFKSGDPTSVKNYRPISLLSNTSKVLERIIYNKIVNQVSTFINPAQFGFMQGRSTTHQLLLFLHNAFSSHDQFDAVYLDISKAFDSVSHSHLLSKLCNFNISGSVWLWFQAYLSNRLQYVSVNNCSSDLLSVESGVPQGSILGPLLFIIFMNDLPNVISDSESLLFADDTKCFRHIRTSPDQQLLQHDLDNLLSWSTSSNLHFNSSKSCHLSFNHKISTSYSISGDTIVTKQSHKDLGVTLSSNLEWKPHHDIILSKAYKTLGLVRRTFSPSISPLTKVKLYVSLIRSQLMYCSPIWRPYLIKDINNLELLQRRATKYILNDYISDYKTRLIKLQLLPLMYILEISDIVFFIKCIKNPTISFNINNFVSFSTSARSGGFKLHHNPATTNKQRHFYFVRICRLWNALPLIDLNLSIDIIRNRIKSFFWDHFTNHFDPLDSHTLHYLCPCSRCVTDHFSINYSTL